MIAYNRQSLDNRAMQQETAEALAKGVITGAEYDRIRDAYPVNLHTPNAFVRIGLFLLTVLIVACGLGLLMLMGLATGEHSAAILVILLGILSNVILEVFIHNRKMYRSGVDDALLWMAGVLIFGGIVWFTDVYSATPESVIVFVLAAWGMLRYADHLMAIIAYGALISILFHLMITSMTILPFVIMAMSVFAYLLFTRLSGDDALRHYHSCLWLLRMAALLSFYLAGNYYVVQNLSASTHVALGWLWWSFTCLVPMVYIVAGIRKKDTVLLWTGLALVAAAVFTVRNYYHVLPAELAMLLGGVFLIATSYILVRYLRTPKKGFTSDAPEEPHVLENLPVESLILAESFKTAANPPLDQSGRFGGGSGGGAGAGGTY